MGTCQPAKIARWRRRRWKLASGGCFVARRHFQELLVSPINLLQGEGSWQPACTLTLL